MTVNCGKCELSQTGFEIEPLIYKVGRVFPMVIRSGFRMGQDIDDHQEDAPHFIVDMILPFLRSTTTAQQPQKMIQR